MVLGLVLDVSREGGLLLTEPEGMAPVQKAATVEVLLATQGKAALPLLVELAEVLGLVKAMADTAVAVVAVMSVVAGMLAEAGAEAGPVAAEETVQAAEMMVQVVVQLHVWGVTETQQMGLPLVVLLSATRPEERVARQKSQD